jgi:sugar phosphate permease
MQAMKSTPRMRGMQRTALTLLVVSGVVNYIDRATLSIANPLIRHDLGLSIADMGLLLSAFLWSYAFAQLPAGGLVDRLGPRRLLALGLTLWSFAQLLGGLVRGFGEFFAARMLLGVGEAPQFPTGARVVRDWFNLRQRGRATGVFNCASTLGTAIAAPLLTVLMLSFGWRWMFAIMGAAGLVVAALWYMLYREPAAMGLDAAERGHLTEGDDTGRSTRVSLREWRQLFRFRTTWGMIAGYFGTIYVTWVYTAWLPSYLEIERHITISKTGMIAAIPYVFGVVGGLWGGWLADWLLARGLSPVDSRKYPMAIGLLGTALFTVLAAEVASNVIAVGCISAALFLVYVTSTTAWAMASVAAPANYTASLGSIQNFGGYFGGALAPTATGFIVQATGSFVPALLLGAAIATVSAVALFFVIRTPITAEQIGAAALPLPGTVAV